MSSSDFHIVMPTGSTALVGGPIADFTAGGTITDTVCFKKYKTAYFFTFWGVGTTGRITATAIPISAVGGTTTTAIPFQYKRVSSTETNTAWTWATSNTMDTTAGSQQLYVFRVSADDLPLVSGVKYEYAYMNFAEKADDPLLGGGFVMMADPRIAEATTDAASA